jgi:osmoprotectant transport system permease protein
MIGAPAPSLAAPHAAGGTVIPNFGRADSCVRNNHLFCWHWFASHWSDTFAPALGQHIVLTVIAVGVGFVLSLVLALIAFRLHWLERPLALFTGWLYTIPSLALFQILVPVTGLTRLTVEIALVSYTLLVIFRNIMVGLRGVPAEVREAARGMGMSPLQSLVRVELPLALPAMIAGLRIATVTVISVATVAAFIIDQGLGAPILQAIQSPFNTQFIAAGGLAVCLALAADALLVGLRRVLTPWARARGG